jgi:hypothetical protein
MTFYNLKIISSGNRMELYKYSMYQMQAFKGHNKKGRKGNENRIQNKDKNRREVLNRARNNIIRLANCNQDMLTFISLTYKENFLDLKESKIHINETCKLIRHDYKNFKYLYVLEFQSRGAIHYHMLCNYPVHVKTAKTRNLKPQEQKLLEQEFYNKYWNHGFVDIRDLSQEGNTNAGLYVAVYLVEDLLKLDLQGSRCYAYSRNLNKPQVDTMYIESSTESILRDFIKSYDLKYASNYETKYCKDGNCVIGNVNYFDMYEKLEVLSNDNKESNDVSNQYGYEEDAR